ncbi:MAG: thymidylate synthase [Candidatus Cloacimonas sp.]
MLNVVSIKATTIPDAWHQLIMSIMDNGRVFKIDEGSYAGDYRLEFDFVIIQILHPEIRPFEPELPDDMKNSGIPNPVALGYIEGGEGFEGDPYVLYLMSSEKKPEEDYTYGQRLNDTRIERDAFLTTFNQVQHVIDKYKTGKIRNNQLCMSVAQPGDMLLKDPPCLQLIDTRIQDGKLHFTTYFRSWDLWGGLPANFGGLQCLKEYMASEIGVEPGETIGISKGLHIYKYVWELAELRRRKTGYVSKFLQEIQADNPICECCGTKMLRFGWYEIDPLYKYWYCLECDKENRFPFLRAQYNGIWVDK